jgi:hypothetical protein
MQIALVSLGVNAALDALLAHFWQGLGIALATSVVYGATSLLLLAAGVIATARDALVTLRVAAGLVFVLCFLRYPYLLLLLWASVNVGIGSSLVLFNGNNLDTRRQEEVDPETLLFRVTSLFTQATTFSFYLSLVFLLGWSGQLPFLARFFNGDVSTFNGRIYLWQALLSHFQVTQWLGNGLQSSDQPLTYLRVPFWIVTALPFARCWPRSATTGDRQTESGEREPEPLVESRWTPGISYYFPE